MSQGGGGNSYSIVDPKFWLAAPIRHFIFGCEIRPHFWGVVAGLLEKIGAAWRIMHRLPGWSVFPDRPQSLQGAQWSPRLSARCTSF